MGVTLLETVTSQMFIFFLVSVCNTISHTPLIVVCSSSSFFSQQKRGLSYTRWAQKTTIISGVISPPYTKVGPWKNNPSANPIYFAGHLPPPKTNMTGWKNPPWMSRCISYWKWEIFQPVMLVFRGDNPNFDKDLPWIYHQNPHKSKPPARTTWTEVQKPYHRKPFSGHL